MRAYFIREVYNGRKFKTQKENSADENSEYYLGIDEEVIDTIDGFINDNKDLKKLSDKAAESAVEILCDAIENNLTVEKEKGEIELGDDDLKVKEIVIKGNGKKLVSAAKEFLKAIKADDDVKALVKKIDSAYQEGFKDQFSDAINTAINQIDSMSNSDKDVAAKAKFELLFKISKKNGSLIGFSATIEDANDTKQSCEFFVGPDIKNPDEIRFSLNDGHDTYEVRYLASENTSSELEVSGKGSYLEADELEKIQENISEFVEKLYPEELF